MQAFVECARQYVQEMGFDEAYLAFPNDPRWRSSSVHVFVGELQPSAAEATVFAHPAFPHMEGTQWGPW